MCFHLSKLTYLPPPNGQPVLCCLPPLNFASVRCLQGTGYGIVLGFGIFFSLFTSLIVWMDYRCGRVALDSFEHLSARCLERTSHAAARPSTKPRRGSPSAIS